MDGTKPRLAGTDARSMTPGRGGLGFILVLALGASGCGTLNPITMGVGIASYVATGKGLVDHAIGTVTKKDCNILGGLLRGDRKICEPHGSAAAKLGFRGLFAPKPTPKLRLSDSMAVTVAESASVESSLPTLSPSLRLSDSIVQTIDHPSARVAGLDNREELHLAGL